MSASKQNLPWLIFCLIVPTLTCAPAFAEELTLYQNVKAPTKWDRGYSVKGTYENGASPDFLIKTNELYLKVQSTRTKWHLYVEVDQPEWNFMSLHELVHKHPEILPKFPKPSAENLGVQWSSDSHKN